MEQVSVPVLSSSLERHDVIVPVMARNRIAVPICFLFIIISFLSILYKVQKYQLFLFYTLFGVLFYAKKA
jgi:hypothetical protein